MIGSIIEPGVWVDPVGTWVTADAATGTSELIVESLSGFAEYGTLLIDGVPLDYSSYDAETLTITLTDALTVDVPAGAEAHPIGADGKVPEDWYVKLEVDPDPDAEGHVVVIPDDKRIGYVVGDALVGQTVEYGFNPDNSGELIVLRRPSTTPSIDLSNADPTTIPDPVATEPPDAPTFALAGLSDSILIQVQPIATSTVLDVYASTDPAFVPGPDSLRITGTRSTILSLTAADDGLLVAETPYFVIVVARNAAGSVAAQAQSVTLDPSRATELLIGKIVSGEVAAGALNIGNVITIDPDDGFRVAHPNGSETRINADGSGAKFAGDGEFDNVSAKRLTLTGTESLIEGALSLAGGVTPPAAPTVSQAGYPFLQLVDWGGEPMDYSSGISGLTRTDTGKWLACVFTGYFWSLHRFHSSGVFDTALPVPDDFIPYGVVQVGDRTHVLGRDGSSGWPYLSIATYDASWTKLGQATYTSLGIDWDSNLALGYDGTDLLMTRQEGTTVTVHKVSTSRVLGTPKTLTVPVSSVMKGITVTAGRWIIWRESGANLAFTSSGGAPDPDRDMGGAAIGAWNDGNTNYHLNANGRIYEHSTVLVDTTYSIRVAARNATLSTATSTAKSYTQMAGTWFRVETDPLSVGDNRPDRVRFYIDGKSQSSLAPGVWFEKIGVPATGADDQPVGDSWPGVTPGSLRTTEADSLGRELTHIGGDGQFWALKGSQYGNITLTPGATATEYSQAVTFREPFDAEPYVDVKSRIYQAGLDYARVTAVDANGFTFVWRKNTLASTTFVWEAHALTQSD